jgi:hypothetical protein
VVVVVLLLRLPGATVLSFANASPNKPSLPTAPFPPTTRRRRQRGQRTAQHTRGDEEGDRAA